MALTLLCGVEITATCVAMKRVRVAIPLDEARPGRSQSPSNTSLSWRMLAPSTGHSADFTWAPPPHWALAPRLQTATGTQGLGFSASWGN